VLLLCTTTGEAITVTLYGTGETKRGAVTFESVITGETDESVMVEVCRVEKGENGEVRREKVSGDAYRKGMK
jgi:DNA repair exonuclease SbcCD ATPase subunit